MMRRGRLLQSDAKCRMLTTERRTRSAWVMSCKMQQALPSDDDNADVRGQTEIKDALGIHSREDSVPP